MFVEIPDLDNLYHIFLHKQIFFINFQVFTTELCWTVLRKIKFSLDLQINTNTMHFYQVWKLQIVFWRYSRCLSDNRENSKGRKFQTWSNNQLSRMCFVTSQLFNSLFLHYSFWNMILVFCTFSSSLLK